MDRSFPAIRSVLGPAALFVVLLLSFDGGVARADADRNLPLDITFPVAGPTRYSDDYSANRDGGARRHQATDIFAPKGTAVHAAVSGRICFAPGIDEPMPGYGYMLRICTGNVVYSYIHLDNDTPGTDDGRGGHQQAYAPGIRDGVDVRRGQLIGWLGDSGNAEDTEPHLHFSIYDRDLDDASISAAPWRPYYRNPFASLRAAQQRGDVVSTLLRLGQRGDAVADWQRRLNEVANAGLVVDGVFGPGTDAATRAFQREAGLADDGVVGPATLAAIGASGTTPVGTVTPTQQQSDGYAGRLLRLTDPMMRGDDVRAWQARMRERGWRGADGQPLDVDGFFGSDSDRAARLLQEEKGLTVDGVVGPATWSVTFGP